jgi:serine protease Do
MRRIGIAVAAVATLVAGTLIARTLEVDVRLRSNAAQARDEIGPAFWKTGLGAAVGANAPVSFADLAERLSPAVVNIEVKRSNAMGGPEEMLEEFFGRRSEPRRKRSVPSSGSGFVIAKDGFIVTNDHVVADAEEITVVFRDGKKLQASVVGRDPETDLALIKVEGGKDLAVAPLGDSDAVRVGDWVMAIGNPFGFEHTVTVGILSARGRNLRSGPYDDFLQTDASINPGNSGGPLIDMTGAVVGINTAIRAGAEGLGFAIPINMAKELLPQLRKTGSVTRGWLGVQIQRVTPPLAEEFGLERPRGALVSQVFEDSPAEKAKLKHGDVILSFNGKQIEDFDDLPRQVAATPPGAEVKVEILRDGKEKTLKATLERKENEPIQLAAGESPSSDWGFDVQDLSPRIAEQLGLESELEGVVITDVDPDTPADAAGLRRGDVILEANRVEISSVHDLTDQLDDDEDPVLLIRRGDGTLYVPLERG